MTFDQIVQLFGALAVIAVNRWGYSKISKELKGYITVEDYKEKISELHGQINTEREERVRLAERCDRIDKELAFVQTAFINVTAVKK